MQYKLIRIFPYLPHNQVADLEAALKDGWQLWGSPFTARPDEAFQAVVRQKREDVPLKEVGRGGSLSNS